LVVTSQDPPVTRSPRASSPPTAACRSWCSPSACLAVDRRQTW